MIYLGVDLTIKIKRKEMELQLNFRLKQLKHQKVIKKLK